MFPTPPTTEPTDTWPRLTAPQWEQVRRLISELEKQRGAKQVEDDEEQRDAGRTPLTFPLKIVCSRTAETQRTSWGVARNMSRSGLSIITRRMYHVAERIVVQIPQPGNQTRNINARVVRCRYIGDLYHEVGLSFLAGAE